LEGSDHGLIEVLSCHLPGGTEENHEKFSKYSQRPVRNLNRAPIAFKSRRLSVDQPILSALERLTVSQLVKKLSAFYSAPRVHYRVHRNLLLAPVLDQNDTVHTLKLISWRSILILPAITSPSDFFPSGRSGQHFKYICQLSHACYITIIIIIIIKHHAMKTWGRKGRIVFHHS
jgi:hypothetical protein